MKIWEPGTRCKLYIDFAGAGPLPVEGDLLRTPAGACYLIDAARPGRRAGRVHFAVTRLERDAILVGDPGVFEFVWNRR